MNSNISKAANRLFFVLLLTTTGLLTACGGGSTSTTSTDNDLPSPVAGGINGEILVPGPVGEEPVTPSTLALLPQITLAQRQFADPNVLLNLNASVIAATGSQIVKTLWTQASGPQVIIPSPLELNTPILLPDVSVATTLEFRLTAQDSEDRINSATLSILVKPVPTFVKVIGGVFNEKDKLAKFKVQLNAPGTSPITVSYVTQDGTATNADYIPASGEITFAPGEVLKEISVTLIDDVNEEIDKSFSLQVTAIDGTVTHANRGVAIIRNGVEPQLPQSIQFTTSSSASIYRNQTFTNTLNTSTAPGSGSIIYSSSNTAVATVNAQGVVTGVSLGNVIITAAKEADDIYLPATASYNLNVILQGTLPVANIEQQDGYSAQFGDTVDLQGSATDQEDGSLPTQEQINQSAATGLPITTLRWTSSIDGFLGYGTSLDTNSLSMGTHTITYSVTDSHGNTASKSIRVLVGNIAPYAFTTASSTYCTSPTDVSNCYYPYRVNDSDLSHTLGGLHSWVHDNTVALPQWIELTWSSPVPISSSVDIYTTTGYIIRDYDIEYLNGQTWVPVASVTNNTELYRTHPIPAITTSNLRVVVRRGSLIQPQHARINEIVVFGIVPFSVD
jgi:hypothetical protein